jgi:hypothetical protein
MPLESTLEAAVERELRDAALDYVRQPVVGNTRPDFLVTTDRGDQIVIEVKNWDPSPAATRRALHQAKRYKELSKAAAALVVMSAGAAIPSAIGGVVPIGSFIPAMIDLAARLAQLKRPGTASEPRESPTRMVFASMPFSGQYDDTYLVAIQPAALAVNAVADRFDYDGSAGDVVSQIKERIRAAEVVVADLSESRANVCHEVGYAEALGRPVIQICATPVASLPFNLRNNRTVPYHIGQATKLRAKLEKELAKTL